MIYFTISQAAVYYGAYANYLFTWLSKQPHVKKGNNYNNIAQLVEHADVHLPDLNKPSKHVLEIFSKVDWFTLDHRCIGWEIS